MSSSVFLTGATGFVGSHVLRELLASGHSVRALARSRDAKLDNVDIVIGDLRNPGALTRAMDGCRYLVHSAALYSFAPSARAEMRRVNVVGTTGILEAARIAGVERAVVTSSSATLHEHSLNGSAYHRSKVEQERAALAARVPSVLILPTAPIGPGDVKPTPTGKMVLDFVRGKVNVLPPRGGMNVVAVEDVAKAHVAALERGRPRERYVIGGENLTFDQIWGMLANATGRRMPRLRIPYTVAWGAAVVEELVCKVRPDREPRVPLEGVRMSRERMFVEDEGARAVLSIGAATPAQEAIIRAVEWYRKNGYAS